MAFSATLLVLALSGLLVFPMDFLRSMAYGGMAAVAAASADRREARRGAAASGAGAAAT